LKYKTIFNIDIILSDYPFDYQKALTKKLDTLSGNFNKSIVNEIVLWKVTRYVDINNETMTLLNRIKKTDRTLKIELTGQLLKKLLLTKGIRLPMASTILRFKNPNIYQIVDQRAYRLLYGNEFKMPHNINKQIDLYLDYLAKLRKVCIDKNIPFSQADRIFYGVDKKLNGQIKLKNYG
jgi:hypothetical protein